MSKVIVSGSVAYDRIMNYPGLFADHFVEGKMHAINLSFAVDKLSIQFGGTAGNIAYNLALLGEQPEVIATVGDDFHTYRDHLLMHGVDPRTVQEIKGAPTASAFIFTDKADNQIAGFHFGAGGNAYESHIETDGRILAIVAPGCDADMRSLPQFYRRQGLRYLYDPGQAIPALSAEALRDGIVGSQVLFANDYELSLLLQKLVITKDELLELVPTIVVTHGGEGSVVLGKDEEIRVAPTKAKEIVDPTGAGDAYRAGFIKGMFMGLPLQSCAQLASSVAAFVVEAYGTQTQMYTLAEVASRYADTYGEKLPL